MDGNGIEAEISQIGQVNLRGHLLNFRSVIPHDCWSNMFIFAHGSVTITVEAQTIYLSEDNTMTYVPYKKLELQEGILSPIQISRQNSKQCQQYCATTHFAQSRRILETTKQKKWDDVASRSPMSHRNETKQNKTKGILAR